MVNLVSLSFLSAITENHRLGLLETTNISHSFGGCQGTARLGVWICFPGL